MARKRRTIQEPAASDPSTSAPSPRRIGRLAMDEVRRRMLMADTRLAHRYRQQDGE